MVVFENALFQIFSVSIVLNIWFRSKMSSKCLQLLPVAVFMIENFLKAKIGLFLQTQILIPIVEGKRRTVRQSATTSICL